MSDNDNSITTEQLVPENETAPSQATFLRRTSDILRRNSNYLRRTSYVSQSDGTLESSEPASPISITPATPPKPTRLAKNDSALADVAPHQTPRNPAHLRKAQSSRQKRWARLQKSKPFWCCMTFLAVLFALGAFALVVVLDLMKFSNAVVERVDIVLPYEELCSENQLKTFISTEFTSPSKYAVSVSYVLVRLLTSDLTEVTSHRIVGMNGENEISSGTTTQNWEVATTVHDYEALTDVIYRYLSKEERVTSWEVEARITTNAFGIPISYIYTDRIEYLTNDPAKAYEVGMSALSGVSLDGRHDNDRAVMVHANMSIDTARSSMNAPLGLFMRSPGFFIKTFSMEGEELFDVSTPGLYSNGSRSIIPSEVLIDDTYSSEKLLNIRKFLGPAILDPQNIELQYSLQVTEECPGVSRVIDNFPGLVPFKRTALPEGTEYFPSLFPKQYVLTGLMHSHETKELCAGIDLQMEFDFEYDLQINLPPLELDMHFTEEVKPGETAETLWASNGTVWFPALVTENLASEFKVWLPLQICLYDNDVPDLQEAVSAIYYTIYGQRVLNFDIQHTDPSTEFSTESGGIVSFLLGESSVLSKALEVEYYDRSGPSERKQFLTFSEDNTGALMVNYMYNATVFSGYDEGKYAYKVIISGNSTRGNGLPEEVLPLGLALFGEIGGEDFALGTAELSPFVMTVDMYHTPRVMFQQPYEVTATIPKTSATNMNSFFQDVVNNRSVLKAGGIGGTTAEVTYVIDLDEITGSGDESDSSSTALSILSYVPFHIESAAVEYITQNQCESPDCVEFVFSTLFSGILEKSKSSGIWYEWLCASEEQCISPTVDLQVRDPLNGDSTVSTLRVELPLSDFEYYWKTENLMHFTVNVLQTVRVFQSEVDRLYASPDELDLCLTTASTNALSSVLGLEYFMFRTDNTTKTVEDSSKPFTFDSLVEMSFTADSKETVSGATTTLTLNAVIPQVLVADSAWKSFMSPSSEGGSLFTIPAIYGNIDGSVRSVSDSTVMKAVSSIFAEPINVKLTDHVDGLELSEDVNLHVEFSTTVEAYDSFMLQDTIGTATGSLQLNTLIGTDETTLDASSALSIPLSLDLFIVSGGDGESSLTTDRLDISLVSSSEGGDVSLPCVFPQEFGICSLTPSVSSTGIRVRISQRMTMSNSLCSSLTSIEDFGMLASVNANDVLSVSLTCCGDNASPISSVSLYSLDVHINEDAGCKLDVNAEVDIFVNEAHIDVTRNVLSAIMFGNESAFIDDFANNEAVFSFISTESDATIFDVIIDWMKGAIPSTHNYTLPLVKEETAEEQTDSLLYWLDSTAENSIVLGFDLRVPESSYVPELNLHFGNPMTVHLVNSGEVFGEISTALQASTTNSSSAVISGHLEWKGVHSESSLPDSCRDSIVTRMKDPRFCLPNQIVSDLVSMDYSFPIEVVGSFVNIDGKSHDVTLSLLADSTVKDATADESATSGSAPELIVMNETGFDITDTAYDFVTNILNDEPYSFMTYLTVKNIFNISFTVEELGLSIYMNDLDGVPDYYYLPGSPVNVDNSFFIAKVDPQSFTETAGNTDEILPGETKELRFTVQTGCNDIDCEAIVRLYDDAVMKERLCVHLRDTFVTLKFQGDGDAPAYYTQIFDMEDLGVQGIDACSLQVCAPQESMFLHPPTLTLSDIFEYTDFSALPLSVNRDASSGVRLELTDKSTREVGSAFTQVPQEISGSWSTEFTGIMFSDSSFGSADGIAFVLQDASADAVGESCSTSLCHGAKNIAANYLAVVFDSYSDNEVGIVVNNLVVKDVGYGIMPTFDDGDEHEFKIDYWADTKDLLVFVNGNFVIRVQQDLEELFPSGAAFIGFTASTGTWSHSRHEITHWKFGVGC